MYTVSNVSYVHSSNGGRLNQYKLTEVFCCWLCITQPKEIWARFIYVLAYLQIAHLYVSPGCIYSENRLASFIKWYK